MVLTPDMAAALPASFVISLVVGAIIGGMIGAFIFVVVENLVVIPASIGVVSVLFIIGAVGNLQTMEYRFFDKELETYEGFLNVSHNNISYDRVTDISFNRSVWQRLFGVGTIKLNTAGGNAQEISISYVKQPEMAYEELRGIIWSGEQPRQRQPRGGGRGGGQQRQPRNPRGQGGQPPRR